MKLIQFENGVKAFKYDSLNDDRVTSLFTTHTGGISTGFYSSLNMGCSTGDSPENVLENCRLAAACMGTVPDRMVAGQQTHTKNVRIVTEADAGKGLTRERDYTDVDGLVTNVKELCLYTTHADCNPVLLYDPENEVIAAVHSGWKGTLLNITAEAIRVMSEGFGTEPARLKAAIGPALCRDCFEVDRDVAELFAAAYDYVRPDGSIMVERGTKAYIDLKEIIRRELVAGGVLRENIEVSDLCTKEHPELFFSHRLTGVKRGVMASMIMMHGNR